MISIASKDAFGGFTIAVFSPKNIPVAPMAMINPSLREPSMFLFQSKLLILLHTFLKHMMSFWWLFFIDVFFIFSLISVICKKHTNTDGKDIKYTNAMDLKNHLTVLKAVP